MDCKRYSDALSDVAAGGPPPTALETHLAACAHCQGELTALRTALVIAGQELDRLAAIEPSAGFAQRVRAAAGRGAATPVRNVPWLWPACAAASALVIAVVLFVAGQPPRMNVDQVRTPVPVLAPAATAPTAAGDPGSLGSSEVVAVAPIARPDGRRAPPKTAEPVILIPAGESEALMAFVASIGPEAPVTDSEDTAARPPPALAALPPITINPIEIVPLDPAPHLGT